ncbi:DUF5005 domain-containing protein [Lentzea tibetensis]|uniref:DUF5005 domain-containing protein n=1 Tax=Lentzea tibetensis TaxID=2591470 RepID=A0A563EJD7_9PSEU|nr:DUF5005 domain-containing protein [Lentzea tibetensis]TWP46979.1 DUF5005 domain-containing protein [Lentzea tibetensis]
MPVLRLMPLLALAMMASSTPTPPQAASPDEALNALWTEYGNAGGRWTGADRTASVPLPDGRTAWLFSDTFLGKVNTDHSRPAGTPMPRNTLVVQEADGSLGATLHGGTPDRPRALVDLPGADEHLWVGDGIVQNGVLRVLYNRYQTTGNGPLDVRGAGTSLATFALPALALTSLITIPVGRNIAWGSEILQDGDHTYVYGAEHDGPFGKHLRLARVPGGDLTGPWEFWTGQGWSRFEEDSVRVLTGVGTAFSVTKVGDEHVLVTVDSNVPFNRNVVAYTASSPAGPFGDPRVLYHAPEAGSSIIVYDASAHPQLSRPGELTVSYNVNSLDPRDALADARIYRPRFIEVPWPPE